MTKIDTLSITRGVILDEADFSQENSRSVLERLKERAGEFAGAITVGLSGIKTIEQTQQLNDIIKGLPDRYLIVGAVIVLAGICLICAALGKGHRSTSNTQLGQKKPPGMVIDPDAAPLFKTSRANPTRQPDWLTEERSRIENGIDNP